MPEKHSGEDNVLRPAGNDTNNGVLIDLLVKPNSKRVGIEGIDPWKHRLVVAVREKALEGKANKAVISVLEKTFNCKAKIVAGHKSREKTVLLSCSIDTAHSIISQKGGGAV